MSQYDLWLEARQVLCCLHSDERDTRLQHLVTCGLDIKYKPTTENDSIIRDVLAWGILS
jgi:hypothetical protein